MSVAQQYLAGRDRYAQELWPMFSPRIAARFHMLNRYAI